LVIYNKPRLISEGTSSNTQSKFDGVLITGLITLRKKKLLAQLNSMLGNFFFAAIFRNCPLLYKRS